jgi:hypothetical protein
MPRQGSWRTRSASPAQCDTTQSFSKICGEADARRPGDWTDVGAGCPLVRTPGGIFCLMRGPSFAMKTPHPVLTVFPLSLATLLAAIKWLLCLFSSALFTKTWRRSEPLPAAARLIGLAVPPFLKACSDRRKDFGGSARFGVRVTILTRSLPALLRGTGSVAKHASLNSLTVKKWLQGHQKIQSWSRSHVCAMEIRISHKESSASSREP